MKKLLTIISVIFFSGTILAQSDYVPMRYKMNFLDSLRMTGDMNIIGSLRVANTRVTATGTQLNYLNVATGRTGSGNVVLSNSPALVTPNLGTPSAIVLTNATGTAPGLTAGSLSRMARTPLSYFNFYSIDNEPINVSQYYGEDGFYIFPKAGTYLHNYLDTTYLGTGTVKFIGGNLGYSTGRLGNAYFTNLDIYNIPQINGQPFLTGLGFTTVGRGLIALTNPSAITFLQVNQDNSVSALSAADFRTAIGVGSGGGTVNAHADTISISAGVLRIKTTPLVMEPYSIQIFSSTGEDITNSLIYSYALDGGVYKLSFYSSDALSNVKLRILY